MRVVCVYVCVLGIWACGCVVVWLCGRVVVWSCVACGCVCVIACAVVGGRMWSCAVVF